MTAPTYTARREAIIRRIARESAAWERQQDAIRRAALARRTETGHEPRPWAHAVESAPGGASR